MALSFASGDYVNIPYDGNTNPAWTSTATQVMSHSLWFKTSGVSTNTGLFSKNITNSGAGHELILDLLGATGKLCPSVNGSTGGYATGTATVNDGNWHHAVGIFNSVSGNTQSCYVDGALDSSFTSSATVPLELVGSHLGKHQDNFWTNFVGEIADYSMFQRALTTDEITALSLGMAPFKIAGGPSLWLPLRGLSGASGHTPDFGPGRVANTISGTSLATDGPPASLFTPALFKPVVSAAGVIYPPSTLRQFWTFG